MHLSEQEYNGLMDRVARLEEYFSAMDFLTKEMKGKILHFQSHRDLLSAKSVLDQAKEDEYGQYYFKGGSAPDFSINGFLHKKASKKITAMEYIPALRALSRIIADKSVLEDFISLGGELVCKERGSVSKELREIKSACKKLVNSSRL